MSKVRVAGIQIACDASKKEMIKKAEKHIQEACENNPGLDIVCLPELFYQSPLVQIENETFGEEPNGAFTEAFKEMARKYAVNIVAGSYGVKHGDKIKNTSLVINREGEIVGEYSKIHLFDSLGAKESDVIEPGNEVGIFDLDFGKIGVVICYDLRFPELMRTLAIQGIDMLLVPAAFFSPRLDHWEILVKSAAVQNTVHVVALNQIGQIKGRTASFFGRSMLVDPWGVIVAGASDHEGYFFGEADLNYTKRVRQGLPCLEHRRTEFYQ